MRSDTWLRTCLVLTGVGLLASPLFARPQQSDAAQQQSGDAVADAARKAREQQKTAPKPKKVYTDDDVKPATPPAQAGAAQPPAQGEPGAVQAAPAGKEDPETVWKKRFAEQREKISKAEKELDILQREEEKAQIQYYPDPQKALQEQNSRKDINDKQAKIDGKKQEIANLKQQLSDMEDELRKSGGDPGWARE